MSNKSFNAVDPFDDPNACPEYRSLSRRAFMKYARLGAATIAPAFLPRVVMGTDTTCADARPRDIFLFVFERGGKDGLASVSGLSPFFTTPYTTQSGNETFPGGLRPVPTLGGDPRDIGLADPDPGDPDPYAVRYEELGEVNGDLFGINKAYLDRTSAQHGDHETLWDLWNAGQVAFISCAGSPDTNRSHFEAEGLVERASPNQPGDEVLGWLSRYLHVMPTLGSPLRAAAFTNNRLVPKILGFAPNTLAFQAVDEVVMPGNPATESTRKAILQERYEEQTQEPAKGAVLTALQTAELLAAVGVNPDPAAKYTNSTFGQQCRNAAALIKACIDIEIIELETYGHDTHANQGPTRIDPQAYEQSGQLNTDGGGYYNRIKDQYQNLTALSIDCAKFWHRMCVMVQPEFGRQINVNGTWGTDHANAALITVFGGRVNGGLHCKRSLGGEDGFPSLDPDNMADNHDEDGIRTTLDYRVIASEILRKCMGVDQATIDAEIFPTTGEEPPPPVPFDASNELGVINATS